MDDRNPDDVQQLIQASQLGAAIEQACRKQYEASRPLRRRLDRANRSLEKALEYARMAERDGISFLREDDTAETARFILNALEIADIIFAIEAECVDEKLFPRIAERIDNLASRLVEVREAMERLRLEDEELEREHSGFQRRLQHPG